MTSVDLQDITWGTDDFIKYEFGMSDVTPKLCASALQFVERNIDIDENDYRQFRALREKVEAAFSNPYNLEPISDNIGKGYGILIAYDQQPSDKAWELLTRYFKLNGWLYFEQSSNSQYKFVHWSGKTHVRSESGQNYLIKIYNQLGAEDGLADA